ncbi:MAG: hypothetical protein A3F73_14025 [Gallionellales bacterium RIFCSPLOWO2_12_FULL_59_22]|nr:MAG: hypothetical protein A2Z65_03600 [Gallionellales bacterium RIFCSPLOWO2_02_58_13]OGT13931.1 MAG: hypothetical protein A3F73_14025 [Gallionellales bacterium RIFCSPLOWO2_12_FULL_59_22]
MPISWKKKNKNLKPAVILNSIEAIRTVSPEGRISFSGFELDDALPALQSMLEFPPAAIDVDKSVLVWKALSSITTKLTPATFESAINTVFTAQNATIDSDYHILTSVSFNPNGLNRRTTIDGSTIRLLDTEFPKKYGSNRIEAITRAKIPVDPTPKGYTRGIIHVRAKNPYGAITKALRTIDLQRAILCLLCNYRMEYRGIEWIPINVVRLGGCHTVHYPDGKMAAETVWFEPNYTEAPIYRPAQGSVLQKNLSNCLRRLFKSNYAAQLSDALLRYVRALDERDQNNAFIKLWGAVEALTSPGEAKYDLVIRRCSFLYRDTLYHRQILEHLRECRNQSVHAGDQSDSAKIHCYQLQTYFYSLVFFHLANVHEFASLDEANQFLDLPTDKDTLLKQKRMRLKALRFVS